MPDVPTGQAPAAAPEAPAPAAPEGSAPQSAASTTKAAPEAPDSVDDLLSEGSFDDLERALDASEDPKRPKPERNEAPEAAPAEEDVESTEESEEGDTPLGDHEEEDNKPLPKNFRFHTEDPKRAKYFRLLKQNPDADPVQLAAIAGYSIPNAPQPAPEGRKQEEAPQAPDPLQGLRDEIAALKEKKKTLRAAYEYGEADEVGETLTEKLLELQKRELEVADEASYRQEFQASYSEARNKAVALYPDTAKPGTRQHKLVAMLRTYKEQTDPAFLQDPSYPMRLLAELQADYPDAFPKAGTPAQPARVPAQPKNPARPLGQVAPGNAGAKQPSSKAELEQTIDGMDLDQLAQLADSVGTQPVQRPRRR